MSAFSGVRVLGPIEVWDRDERLDVGGLRQLALLAILALNVNRVVSSDSLMDGVWGHELRVGRKSLQMAVSRLRQTLAPLGADGEPLLRTVTGGYLLTLSPDRLDSHLFEQRLREGERALAEGDVMRARTTIDTALALWRGPPFAEVTFADFAQGEIRRLEELRLRALEVRIDADLRLSRHAALIDELQALVVAEPTREHLVGCLMLALYRCGRQVEALEVYQRLRERLARDVGLEPGPTLKTLETQILCHAPELDVESSVDLAATERTSTSSQGKPLPPRPSEAQAERTIEPEAPGLPPALRPVAAAPYVGRDLEQQSAEQAIREAAAGACRIVVISGEPGVGKTRLAARVALKAHERGYCVGWATGREGLGAPYAVWSTLLSQLIEHAPRRIVQEIASRRGGELVRIVPSLADQADRVSEPQRSDAETERFLMFQAVIGLLEQITGLFPVALVFDDLQWADAPSLELLQHVAGSTGHLPLVMIATNRDSAVHGHAVLRDALAAFHRSDGSRQVLLGGLRLDDITELISAIAGHELGATEVEVANQIAAETDNPFFIVQILRNLAERGFIVQDPNGKWRVRGSGTVPLPLGVREVVAARVGRLGEATEAVLEVASVIGETFDVALLARVIGRDHDDVLEGLEAAVRASMLTESTQDVGRFSFAHALFNHCLYEQVGPTRRAGIHRRIAEATEAIGQAAPERVTELAHHWALAKSEPRKTVHYAQLAGKQALARLAPDHAVRWFNVALEALGSAPDSPTTRCELLIDLGEALRQAGDPSFRRVLLDASALADELGDVDQLTRSVLANTLGTYGTAGRPDPERVAVLEHTSRRLPDDAPDLPLVLAIRGREVYYGGDADGGVELVRHALSLARNRSDARGLAAVVSYVANIGPVAPLKDHDALVCDLARLAVAIADPELQFRAAYLGFIHAMHEGARGPLDAALAEMLRLAEAIGQPVLRWTALWCHSAQRWIAGDLVGSETLTKEAAAIAVRHAIPQAMLVTFGQLMAIRTEQDHLDELVEPLKRQTEDAPDLRLLHVTRGFVAAERGHLAEAAAALMELASDGFRFGFHQTRAFNLARCADIALRVGELEVAARLYPMLLDQRPLFATTSGVSTRGSVELNLGRLASVLGRYATADEHLTEAMSAHTRFVAPLLTARTHVAVGESLLARGNPADARQSLRTAAELGRQYGSRAIEREATALLGETATPQRVGG